MNTATKANDDLNLFRTVNPRTGEAFVREKKIKNLRIYDLAYSADTSDPTVENISELIRERAYQLFEERGRQSGHELDDWLQAEQEIRTHYGI